MLGWLIVFASMAAPGTVMTLMGGNGAAAVKTAGLVFALLFMIGVFTRLIRGRVW